MAKSTARPARAKGRRRTRIVVLLVLPLLAFTLGLWLYFGLSAAADRAAQALATDPATAPVEVFAAPRLVRAGGTLDPAATERELISLGYRRVTQLPNDPGEYRREPGKLTIYRRTHLSAVGNVTAAFAAIGLSGERVTSLVDARGRALDAFALEPVRLGAFHGETLQERAPLSLARFPQRLIDAVLISEDPRFLEHRGLDWRGIARAVRDNLFGGDKLQGGSTITQQVIKNRVVGTERTISRKLHEIALAPLVERRVGKDRLLAIYLNEIYLGQRGAVSIVGMPAAAMYYFGKNLGDLSLPEVAMLGGMIASPGRFDPRRHPQAARARRDWVLGRMAAFGKISSAEATAAQRTAVETGPPQGPVDVAGDVLDAVHRELTQRGWEPRPGRAPGRVDTTIDAELQVTARQALQRTLRELEQEDRRRAPLEGAVLIASPRTGEILALVGGREGTRGGFHRALDARRQPGSTFKPFVALAGFEKREVMPSTLMNDSPLELNTPQGRWAPENFDHEFHGDVTLRRAIEESINVPLVRLALQVGPEAVVETAHRLGIESSLPLAPSIALGTGEVTPRELTTAYVTLADFGEHHPLTLLRSVDALSGELSERVTLSPLPLATPAVDPADAYLVLDTLMGVADRGTARVLAGRLAGRRIATKTGSTQDGRDAWFVLVSGNAVVIAWVGRDDAQPARLTGAGAALPVVRKVLEATGGALLAPLPAPPEGVIQVDLCLETGMRAGAKCPDVASELFRDGEEPELCSRHVGFWRRLFGRP